MEEYFETIYKYKSNKASCQLHCQTFQSVPCGLIRFIIPLHVTFIFDFLKAFLSALLLR